MNRNRKKIYGISGEVRHYRIDGTLRSSTKVPAYEKKSHLHMKPERATHKRKRHDILVFS